MKKSTVIWYAPPPYVCIYTPITVTSNSCIRQLIVGDLKSIATNSDVIQSCIVMFVSAHPLASAIRSTLHTQLLQYEFSTKRLLSSKLWCSSDLFPWAISYKILNLFLIFSILPDASKLDKEKHVMPLFHFSNSSAEFCSTHYQRNSSLSRFPDVVVTELLHHHWDRCLG